MENRSISDQVRKNLARQREVRQELRELQSEMAEVVERFDGTLKEAVVLGLVKLVGVPSGYVKWLQKQEGGRSGR